MTKTTTPSRRSVLLAASASIGLGLINTRSNAAVTGRTGQSSTADPILIGQSAVLSGPSAALGLEMRDGIRAAFASINASGGIFGRPLSLVSLDDGYEPIRAAENTVDLVSECLALVGYVGTATTVACLPTITSTKIPLVGPFTGAGSIRIPMNPYVFNIRASYADEGIRIVDLLTMYTGAQTKVGFVYQDDGYGLAVKSAIEGALQKKGLSIVAAATVKRNSLDVQAAAEVMVKSGVSAVVFGSTYHPTSKLIKAIRAGGLHPQFASVSFVGTSGLIDNFVKDAQGLHICQVMPSPTGIAKTVVRSYQAAMRTVQNDKFTYGSIEGFIAASVLIEGLKRAGKGATRAQLTQALATLEFDLGGFKVAFGPETRQGSSFAEMTLINEHGRVMRA